MTITITPYLLYSDVDAALAFLHRAFGFDEVLRYTAAEGYVNHAEARLGESLVLLGDPRGRGEYRNPAALGGATVLVIVDGVEDVDALCERARDAGATITQEPADQDYAPERRFGAKDPEGHSWYFSQKIAAAPADDVGATPDG